MWSLPSSSGLPEGSLSTPRPSFHSWAESLPLLSFFDPSQLCRDTERRIYLVGTGLTPELNDIHVSWTFYIWWLSKISPTVYIHIHIYIYISDAFPLLKNTECSSLWYMVDSCWLSSLHRVMCVYLLTFTSRKIMLVVFLLLLMKYQSNSILLFQHIKFYKHF